METPFRPGENSTTELSAQAKETIQALLYLLDQRNYDAPIQDSELQRNQLPLNVSLCPEWHEDGPGLCREGPNIKVIREDVVSVAERLLKWAETPSRDWWISRMSASPERRSSSALVYNWAWNSRTSSPFDTYEVLDENSAPP